MHQYGCFSLKKELLEEWFKYRWNAYKLKSIEKREILAMQILLPLLPEQRRIVACLDALRRLQAEISAKLDALMPTVLDMAFKGEL